MPSQLSFDVLTDGRLWLIDVQIDLTKNLLSAGYVWADKNIISSELLLASLDDEFSVKIKCPEVLHTIFSEASFHSASDTVDFEVVDVFTGKNSTVNVG